MLVNQVLDIFQDQDDVSNVWLLANDQNNRNGYLCLKLKDYPVFSELINSSISLEDQQARAAELLAADDTIQDFSQRPRLEDASPALQVLYDEMEGANSTTYFDFEKNQSWENLGLTQEEYETQIDTDIEKFGLDGIICKHKDDDVLYTCYGDFLCCFSKPGGKEITSLSQSEDLKDVPNSDNNPLRLINFLPIGFQRDKYYPFKICEIITRNEQGPSYVSYLVIRDGKDEAIFTAPDEKENRDQAYFSALDYIAATYHDTPVLALEYFDGVEYTKKYYEIALLLSNPPTRLQYSPKILDAFWRQQLSDYSTEKVFADTFLNGELAISIIKELEDRFNASLENPTFQLDAALISKLDTQPSISEIRALDNTFNIVDTPLYAAAQYEWEKERTKKIFDTTEKELLSYLNRLDAAIAEHGSTRVSLEYFSDILRDLCYGKEDKLKEIDGAVSVLFESAKDVDYMNCHKVFTVYKQLIEQEKGNGGICG